MYILNMIKVIINITNTSKYNIKIIKMDKILIKIQLI